MNRTNEISDKWIKASVVGTIWASSEIVLGSFLHNLRIPFSSNLLTAIGIIVLISTSYKWTERGLFWRAGLICALMKTMSPSAVIFGPMIAIFSQAVMLEIFTRLLGRNVVGFLLGAMFATTWNLLQKIMNFIIFYGFNIVNVYVDLLKYAQKQLNIHVDLVWLPILLLALLYCSIGLAAAIIGIKVGKKLVSQPAENKISNGKAINPIFSSKAKEYNYSILWLFLNILFIFTAFLLLNFRSWIWWTGGIATIVTVWVIRYKRALRQLSRPRFWVYFAVITMLTAFVITKIQSEDLMKGLITGIQMNFRAAIVILGFSVLGTELYNPKIREFFLRTSFKQLPLALELSFESLPIMIAAIPDFKEIMKSPVSVIYRVISQIEFRLDEIKKKLSGKVIIITGKIGEGKTTTVRKIVENLKAKNIPVNGVYTPRVMENGLTTGYDIVDIELNVRTPFLRQGEEDGYARIGRFNILPQGLNNGVAALTRSLKEKNRLVVIDEVGKLELEGKGWSEQLISLLQTTPVLLFAIRDTFAQQVIQQWDIKNCTVLSGSSENVCLEATDLILKQLS